MATTKQAQADQAMQEQSDLLLEQAKAKDPGQRAETITNLISGGLGISPLQCFFYFC